MSEPKTNAAFFRLIEQSRLTAADLLRLIKADFAANPDIDRDRYDWEDPNENSGPS